MGPGQARKTLVVATQRRAAALVLQEDEGSEGGQREPLLVAEHRFQAGVGQEQATCELGQLLAVSTHESSKGSRDDAVYLERRAAAPVPPPP
jgi:hypothetical protein